MEWVGFSLEVDLYLVSFELFLRVFFTYCVAAMLLLCFIAKFVGIYLGFRYIITYNS